MPRVQNPNASGLTTVTTDGITIQGAGTVASPVAILAVKVDGTTVTGAGTVASPLAAVAQNPSGWPLTYYIFPSTGGSGSFLMANVANTVKLIGVTLPAAVTFTKFIIPVLTLDATNLYDFGIYSAAGALLAHIGAQHIPATGFQTFSVVGGSKTLQPGRYYLGTTGNANTAQLQASSLNQGYVTFFFQGNFVASSAGALPSSITPPADAPADTNIWQFAFST